MESLITSTPITPDSQQEITVYRACPSTSAVTCSGGFGDSEAEAICFLPSRDGMLRRISIRASCFEGVEQTLRDQECNIGITANLGFSEMVETNVGVKFNPLPNAPQTIENLPLSLANITTNGRFLSANLPVPIAFKQNVWTAVVISFPNCAIKRTYISPCSNEYVHNADPSVVFKFRDWRGAPASKFGLIDHFVVTLT